MQRKLIRSVVSSLIGNVLEWYEYTLYAYFATVISSLFFPSDNQFVSMIMTFSTFAVGLAARPIGGIIFGYIGDKISRKSMLVFTMMLMTIPTLCIGMLPTYDKIGIAAPIILIILRILQGLALGGEFGASCTYLYESVPYNRRGFFGTLALTGVGLGLIFSSCTIVFVEKFFSNEEVYLYAWRLPFFISVLGACIAFYMRKSLMESDCFSEAKNNNQLLNNPFVVMLKNHKLKILKLFGIFITTQVSFFVVFIFGKSMMIKFLGYDSQLAGEYSLFTVIFGYLSDKVNKKYIILCGSTGILLLAYPFIHSLQIGSSHATILLLSLLMGMLIGMTEGTLNPLTAESFPTNIRATSIAFCWNFSSVIFGSVAPIISMWLIENFGSVYIIAYYLITVCAITVSTVTFMIIKQIFQKRKSTHFRNAKAEFIN